MVAGKDRLLSNHKVPIRVDEFNEQSSKRLETIERAIMPVEPAPFLQITVSVFEPVGGFG